MDSRGTDYATVYQVRYLDSDLGFQIQSSVTVYFPDHESAYPWVTSLHHLFLYSCQVNSGVDHPLHLVFYLFRSPVCSCFESLVHLVRIPVCSYFESLVRLVRIPVCSCFESPVRLVFGCLADLYSEHHCHLLCLIAPNHHHHVLFHPYCHQ